MAKYPVPGQVKTRLSPPFSLEMAADFATALVLDTVAMARRSVAGLPVTVMIAAAPDGAADRFSALFAANGMSPPPVIDQGPGDLSDRLCRLSDRLLASFGAVFFMQADGPCLPVGALRAAVTAIDMPDVDLVIGPAEDGGYWTIGLKRPAPGLFLDMVWSTPDVFAETEIRVKTLELRVAYAPRGRDVDVPQDLEPLIQTLAVTPSLAPKTAAFLAEQGLIPS